MGGHATEPNTRPGPGERGVFVVVPAYNEGPALADVLEELAGTYRQVVVVDDGSTDDTYEVAVGGASYVLRHLVNRGQGAALQTGIRFALLRGARVIVTFDADGQHRAEDMAALVQPILSGECDITLGSRFLGRAVDMPRSRRAALKAAVVFSRLMSGVKLSDAHNGLRAFSRRAAERLKITQDRMAHASELTDFVARSGLTYREVPVQIRYTRYSLGKGQSLRHAVRILIHYLFGRVDS